MIRVLRARARPSAGPPGRGAPLDAVRPRADTRPRHAVDVDRILISTVACGWGITVACLAFGIGDPGTQRAVADVGEACLDLLAAAIVLRAALRADVRRIGLGWAVLGMAMLVYALGDIAWTWLDLGGGGSTSPSVADVAYVAYYPIVGIALLLFQRTSSARSDAVRLTIDSLIVVIGGGIVVWHTLFRPLLASLDPDPLAATLSLGYPIGDLVLLFGVAATALRHPPEIDTRALVALVGGLGLMFVADVGYGQLSLTGSYGLERWPDIVYLSSTLLIALAGYFQVHPGTATEGRGRALSKWLLALPYVALVAGYSVLIALALGEVTGELIEVLYGAVALTAIVLLRQELVLRENSRLQADQVRRESEARSGALSANASDAVVLVDRDGVVTDATATVGRVLGVDGGQLVGRPISRLVHADDAERMQTFLADVAAGRSVARPLEWRLWDRAGVWRQVETIATNLLDDPSIGRIVLTTHDVGERKTLQRQLTQVSLHDPLTDLPNRALFLERVGEALASAADASRLTTVISVGLDRFTRVNESLGHMAGDQVLREVAGRLRASVGPADTCARVGGDEFGILLVGGSTPEDVLAAGHRVLAAIRVPVDLSGDTTLVTASVGISTAPPTGSSAGSLLRRSGIARSVARGRGGDRVVVFEPGMDAVEQAAPDLGPDLQQAMDRAEFVLEYEPIVDLETGELVGGAAGIVWDHPIHGRISPSVFIPVAEEAGLVDEIGAWVLRTACTEAARWAALSPGRVPRVSIRLSAHQLADPQLAWTVQAAMAHAGAAPGWVTLELTERMLMQDGSDSLERLHTIRALGVQIAIDDFGTGYSSLVHLERYPVSQVRIDRSLVAPLDDPTRGAGVVHAIVEVGRALGLTTVAEGVETPTQLHRLREMGCGFGQGYAISGPLGAEDMADVVRRRLEPAFASEVGNAEDRWRTAGVSGPHRARVTPPTAAGTETRPKAWVGR